MFILSRNCQTFLQKLHHLTCPSTMYEGSGCSTSSPTCVWPRLILVVRVSQPGASSRARGWPGEATSRSLQDPALCDVGLTATTVVIKGEDKPWPNATCSAAQAWVTTSAPSWYPPFCSATPSNAWLTFQIYQHVCHYSTFEPVHSHPTTLIEAMCHGCFQYSWLSTMVGHKSKLIRWKH